MLKPGLHWNLGDLRSSTEERVGGKGKAAAWVKGRGIWKNGFLKELNHVGHKGARVAIRQNHSR